MAKITNNFVLGLINRDADERLMPNGAVRELQNLIISASESDDQGAIENILRNKILNNLEDSSAKVIGSVFNDNKNVIYYFVASDTFDYIFEYNIETGVNDIVLQTSSDGGLLNFNKDKYINNTDVINRGGSGTELDTFKYNPEATTIIQPVKSFGETVQDATIYLSFDEPFVSGSVVTFNLKLKDLGVKKYSFDFSFVLKKTIENGVVISERDSLVAGINEFLSTLYEELDTPEDSTNNFLLQGGNAFWDSENERMVILLPMVQFTDSIGVDDYNAYQVQDVSGVQGVTTLHALVDEFQSELLAFSGDDNEPRIINVERCKLYLPDQIKESDLKVIKPKPIKSPNITPFISEEEGITLDDKFITFAYRYRYKDTYYSAISSSTEYAFSPKPFFIDFDTYENIGMSNIFNAVKIEYNTGDENVEAIELLFRESNSLNWNLIKTIEKKEEGLGDEQTESFNFINNKKYRTLPEREYFRTFDNVPLKSNAQCYAGSRLFYGVIQSKEI